MKEILQAAGFADVAFTDVHEPVYYGPDVAAALDWIRGFTCTGEVLKRLDPAAAKRAVERLREALAALDVHPGRVADGAARMQVVVTYDIEVHDQQQLIHGAQES